MEETFGEGGMDGIGNDPSAQGSSMWVHRGNGVPYVENTRPAAQPVPPLSPNGSLWASILRQQPPGETARSLIPAFPQPDPGIPSSYPRYVDPPFSGMSDAKLDTALLPTGWQSPQNSPLKQAGKPWYQVVPWPILVIGGLASWYWIRRYREGK
jgi:hypothetical protein